MTTPLIALAIALSLTAMALALMDTSTPLGSRLGDFGLVLTVTATGLVVAFSGEILAFLFPPVAP
jgi:hypothetical protein